MNCKLQLSVNLFRYNKIRDNKIKMLSNLYILNLNFCKQITYKRLIFYYDIYIKIKQV